MVTGAFVVIGRAGFVVTGAGFVVIGGGVVFLDVNLRLMAPGLALVLVHGVL